METKEIEKEAEAALSELIGLLSALTPGQINKVPFEGSWTAGELAQHMILSNAGFVSMMNGPVKDADRAPDAAVAGIKQAFLNFGIKMKSPDFIMPETKDYDKDELLDTLRNISAGFVEAAETLDPAKICTSFEIPVLGYLTRFEAIAFVNYHTQRHVHQMKGISTALNK